MERKNKRRVILTITAILFFIWIIIFGIFSVSFKSVVGGESKNVFLINHIEAIGQYLTFTHTTGRRELFTTIILFGIIALSLILVISIIALSIGSKKYKKIGLFFVPILFFFPVFEGVGAFFKYSGASELIVSTTYNTILFSKINVFVKIGEIALLLVASLTALFALIYSIMTIAYLAKERKAVIEKALTEEETKIDEELKEKEDAPKKTPEVKEDKEDLESLIRRIVREELEKVKTTPTQIVQNFYGYNQKMVEEAVVEKVENEIVEDKKEEPAPEAISEVVAEEEVKTPEKEVIITEDGKKIYPRISFKERMISAEKEMKDNYNELKSELLSYGLKSRISSSGDNFRLHCKTYCKITISGNSLKLYLALDPAKYLDGPIPVQDASKKNIYQEIPLVFKVKSGLSMRRAKTLIREACENDNLTQEKVTAFDWATALEKEVEEEEE